MNADNDDRTVHAEFPGIAEVVRYNRAGKWYVEFSDGRKRRHVGVLDAAEVAADLVRRGGSIYYGRPGGGKFDYWAKSRSGTG